MKLVECVPNFSEGRDRSVIEAIAGEVERTPETVLLGVDSGRATHRTVVTFAGPLEAVEAAAFHAVSRAAERIDMALHRGVHPRIGGTDVVPFVPLTGTSMEDCVRLARRVGRRIGEELGIPVYLYAQAALRPERRLLSALRRGGYEALERKLREEQFAPDFGPPRFDPRRGATVVGARELLIAWNLNLDVADAEPARRIAGALRESGRAVRDAAGEIARDDAGRALRVRGRFRSLEASGWFIEEYGRAQVTCNVLDYHAAPLLDVYEACREEAERIGVGVTGSELIGLVPLDALLAAGDAWLEHHGGTPGGEEAPRVEAAVRALGLEDLRPFDPQARILEYRYLALRP